MEHVFYRRCWWSDLCVVGGGRVVRVIGCNKVGGENLLLVVVPWWCDVWLCMWCRHDNGWCVGITVISLNAGRFSDGGVDVSEICDNSSLCGDLGCGLGNFSFGGVGV
ncbi:hypothetical protein CTI12_AA414600 [Artemisia annua]|uniref:Uncharacterized protein n=1 Tax=Artemisia annua TaxID=35608 RepID=A0A2U1L655_ARTAN|nr:hypothetical protein CTI12_AA414600 [Artemisia annua]